MMNRKLLMRFHLGPFSLSGVTLTGQMKDKYVFYWLYLKNLKINIQLLNTDNKFPRWFHLTGFPLI